MKLHRMEMTNFKGVAHRAIDLPDRGVVVICGANEIGKTSLIEALDLLLEFKASSRHKEVTGVKPAHADVATEVVAEISSGKYRFRYRKRFNKGAETELSITAPANEQLTGDQAHERVQAMLAETMDTGLWQAQRVLQTGSTAAVTLTECDALAHALDVAAGETAAPSGTETVVIEAIKAEFATYFTPTGKLNRDYKQVVTAVTDAEAEVRHCREALNAVEDLLTRHGEFTCRRTEASSQRRAAGIRRKAAQEAADQLAELTAQMHKAEPIVEAARQTEAAAVLRRDERRQLLTDAAARQQTIATLTPQLNTAAQAESEAGIVAGTAAGEAQQADVRVQHAEERVVKARNVIDAVAAAGRLAEIDAAQAELTRIAGELSQITITDDLMAGITDLAATVQRYDDQLRVSADAVEFTAAADLELLIDGEPLFLAAGECWQPTSAAATTVELPGLLSVRIDPGVTTAEAGEKLVAAQRLLGEKLAAAGVTGCAQAQNLHERRRTLAGSRSEMAAKLSGLCGGGNVGELRAHLAAVRAEVALTDDADSNSAQADFATAEETRQLAQARAGISRQHGTDTAAVFTEKANEVKVLHAGLAAAATELRAVQDRLVTARIDLDDDQVVARAAADAEALRAAEAVLAELTDQRAARNPVGIETELAVAVAADEALTTESADIDRGLSEIIGALDMAGSEGRRGQLDEALTAEEHARRGYERMSSRARAAELLLTVVQRHQSDTHRRYAEPFRRELERLGRPVFGSTLQLEIDKNLTIISRTLEGRTVPFDSLSGGAKEQLGILVRLTGAALVATDDTVPVVIDDALGFADPVRLRAMCGVLGTCGHDGQVIVLTCVPSRYNGIDGAVFIELTA